MSRKNRGRSVNSRGLCRINSCPGLALSDSGLCRLHEARQGRAVPNTMEGTQRERARALNYNDDVSTKCLMLEDDRDVVCECVSCSLSYEHRAQQFYRTQAWQTLSKLQRTREPLCEHCKANGRLRPADVADHIVELKDDWSKGLELSNLQSLCHQCHNRKTQVEKRKRKEKNSLNSR